MVARIAGEYAGSDRAARSVRNDRFGVRTIQRNLDSAWRVISAGNGKILRPTEVESTRKI